MEVEIVAAGQSQKAILENLFPLYLHDLSEFLEIQVDDGGRFLAEGALDVWWEREGLFPFLIRCDTRIAGFALVASPPFVSPGREYRMNDFFILKRYRRQRTGQAAATAVFDRLPGDWEVGWAATNTAASAFWRRTIAQYTSGCYQEGLVKESSEESLPGLYFSNR